MEQKDNSNNDAELEGSLKSQQKTNEKPHIFIHVWDKLLCVFLGVVSKVIFLLWNHSAVFLLRSRRRKFMRPNSSPGKPESTRQFAKRDNLGQL